MKCFTLILLYFFALSHSFSQQDIHSFIKLDTLFSTGIKIDNEDVVTDNVKFKLVHDNVWLFYPNWKDNDSIHFLKLNLKTYTKQLINIYVPGISFKILSPNIKNFDINDSALVILFHNNCFAYFKLKNKNYVFDFIEPLQYSFQDIRLLPNSRLLIYNNYNSHPTGNPDKTILHVYNCKTHKIQASARPHFNNIAFSHFSPNHWIDVNANSIMLSQTSSYRISFFDFNLTKINEFAHSENDWVYADTNYINILEGIKPRISPKDIIDRLSPMEDSVSRIEAIYTLSPTQLLVRKTPANSKRLNRLRTYDVLKLNSKSNIWKIALRDITDKKPDENEVITKQNFPINSVFHEVSFNQSYYIKLLPRFTPFQLGKSIKENKALEEKALGTTVPEMYIEIFKVHFN